MRFNVVYRRSWFIQANKADLRAHFRQLRQSIPIADRLSAAQAAAQNLSSSPMFIKSTHIGCYLSVRDEMDTLPLIKMLIASGKHCYLPVLSLQKSLRFVEYHEGDTLIPNQYGIPEPETRMNDVQAVNLDLLILPLLAFDAYGHRLGMGGGYYDRTLSFKLANILERPQLLGLAYAVQEAPSIPVESWDVALDGVITENSVRIFQSLSK